MAQGAGDAIKGIFGTSNWNWKLQDEGTKALRQVVRAGVRRPPSQAAQTCYVQTLLYANAVETAGTFYPPEVIKALEGFEFDGMGNGPTEYRAADHQCFKDVLVVKGKEKPGEPVRPARHRQGRAARAGRVRPEHPAFNPDGKAELGPYEPALGRLH